MRNPIRLKNFRPKFIFFYLVGLALIAWVPTRPASAFTASPFIAGGLLIRSWGAGHLVKNDALTTTGPYAHLRHPLYAGTILLATGFAILFGGFLAAALLAAIWPWFGLHYFPRKERLESARLHSRYGDAYALYRDAVPALWPRLRAWAPDTVRDGWAPSAVATLGGPRRWTLERYSDNNELGTVLGVAAALCVVFIRARWVAG